MMSQRKILFVSHSKTQCGVYEFGNNIAGVLQQSQYYEFVRAECASLADLEKAISENKPTAIIYNYHPTVMPWLCTKITKGIYRNNIAGIKVIQIGIIHEITQQVADSATGYMNKWILGTSQRRLNSLFNFYIAADPTLLLKNPLVFKTGRLVPVYNKPVIIPATTTIGSFGFGTPKKGFESVVQKVQEEFDEAIIRLNIPSADFGDKNGIHAKQIADNCQSLIKKPGIKLEVSHRFMDNQMLLDFLAANSLNVFLYENMTGRGISSAIDNAMAVKKPVAISGSPMFRHILAAQPSVCVEDNTLQEILKNGFTPLEKMAEDWNKENLLWDYERVLNAVISKARNYQIPKMGIVRTLQSRWRKLFSLPDKSFTWLRNTAAVTEDSLVPNASANYTPVVLKTGQVLNRILDDEARTLYHPAIEKLFEFVPKTMSKKIARANVQQAFIFDTVLRLVKDYKTPKLLCVGSYEDTASMGLQKMGYTVEEIDPMVNYFLQDFFTKPSTKKASYDIIFSTSVIEHDPDDKSFMECIEGLMTVGGAAVITCDYKDGWKQGEPKPVEDARFYTKEDLTKRLLSYTPKCELVDTPQWECPNPDFNYLGKYQYTFATFVIKKKIV